ncbi:MAG: hypothetical protein WAO00_09100 [Chthoniobacterales bacterium]
MRKFKAELEESRAKMTDKESSRVNDFLKGMHELCAAKEKKLLYEVDHEAIAREARLFAASLNWARTSPNQRVSFRDDELTKVPAIIRSLKPTSVIVSPESVHIELGGGLQHQGLTVFREAKGGSGTVEVGRGVWYMSENNRRFIGESPPAVPK